MPRIGLLSDTHGWLDPRIRQHFDQCDEIWHAGDIGADTVAEELASWKPLRAVHGNIDDTRLRSTYPEHQRFTCGGVRVWITHIGGRPPRYDRHVQDELRKDSPDLFICGHSHILKVQRDEKFGHLHLNPGAAGKHGFHKVRTLLEFVVDGKSIRELQAVEIGLRGSLEP